MVTRLIFFVTEQRLRRDSHIVKASVPCFEDTGSKLSCCLVSSPDLLKPDRRSKTVEISDKLLLFQSLRHFKHVQFCNMLLEIMVKPVSFDVHDNLKAGEATPDDNNRAPERDRGSGRTASKAAEAASLTIFCWTADCERLHLRVEIHLYITRQWALSCLQSNTD